MGRRGPPNTPSAIARAQGRQASKIPKNEPIPPPGDAVCPKWLCREAKAEWKKLAPQLDAMGVLACIDVNMLARYCDSWVRWKAAIAVLHDKGETWMGKPLPEVKIARELAEELRKLEHYFGMSPASRASLTIEKGKVDAGSIEAFEARKPKLKIANGSA